MYDEAPRPARPAPPRPSSTHHVPLGADVRADSQVHQQVLFLGQLDEVQKVQFPRQIELARGRLVQAPLHVPAPDGRHNYHFFLKVMTKEYSFVFEIYQGQMSFKTSPIVFF